MSDLTDRIRGELQEQRERRYGGGASRASFPYAEAKNTSWLFNRTSDSGVNVTQDNALDSAALFCGLQVISGTLSTMPVAIMQKSGNRREEAPEHPLDYLLSVQPNPELSPPEMFQWMFNSVKIAGNAYAYIEWQRGWPVAIWPLLSSNMALERKGNSIQYTYRPGGLDNKEYTLDPATVWHQKGFFLGGLAGLSCIDTGKKALELGLARQQYAARFFGGDGMPGLIATFPEMPPPEEIEKLKRAFREQHSGAGRSHNLTLEYGGMTYRVLGIKPAEAQMFEGQQFDVLEVCRVLNIPPTRLHAQGAQPKANVEQEGIQFWQSTIRPLAVEFEKRMALALFTEGERREGYYFRFNLDALLRTDAKTRAEVTAIQLRTGVITRNEARALDDMNPLEAFERGDETTKEVNTEFISQTHEANAVQVASKPEPESEPAANADDGDVE